MDLKAFIDTHCNVHERRYLGADHESSNAAIVSQFIDDIPPGFVGPILTDRTPQTFLWYSEAERSFICFKPWYLRVTQYRKQTDFNQILEAVKGDALQQLHSFLDMASVIDGEAA